MLISTEEINWFYDRPSDLLNCKGLIRNQFIRFAIDVGELEMIKWIFEHSTELKTTKRKLGKIIFRRAITGPSNGGHIIRDKNINYPLLYWLHNNIDIVDLFKNSIIIRMKLFIDIFSHDGISYNLLDWLYSDIPDLFKGIDEKGKSFFHYAALLQTPDVIKWLFTYLPELAYLKDNNGKTAYDIAVKKGSQEVVDWISVNIPDLCQG